VFRSDAKLSHLATLACENCGTALAGEYCQACGQRAIEGDDLTLRHFFRVAADEILHLGLLFNPGTLTAAYLSGRRAPFTSPVKLYLVCAAIFLLLAPLAGFTLEQMLAGDSSGER
jgi:hypothetical protein